MLSKRHDLEQLLSGPRLNIAGYVLVGIQRKHRRPELNRVSGHPDTCLVAELAEGLQDSEFMNELRGRGVQQQGELLAMLASQHAWN
jgi:hypothetical protein